MGGADELSPHERPESPRSLLMTNEFDAPALADTERVALIDESGCLTLLGSDSHSVIPADLSGKVLWEVVHPSDIAAAHRAVREAFATGARTTIRVRVQDDGGGWHTVDGSVRRLDGEVPPQAMLAVTHVSEGLPIEPRTLDAEEQLRRAGKLEVLGRLAGGISHDFGNLLTIIVNDIGRVLDALPADSGLRAPAESVRAAAERAAGMVRHLLAFSRPHSPAPAVLDVNALLDDAEHLLRRLVGEDVSLRIERGRGLWPVHADRTEIEQVLLNLAVNARDAMPGGGVLTIQTRNVPPGGAPADETVAEAGCVSITVTDTGVGMDRDTQARAFDPFFTTKESHQGTGIGLATVRQIASDSGGSVHLESRQGVGTTVTFAIPRAGEVPIRAGAGDAAAIEGGTETLLVVEDEARVRELVADMLELAGYDVLAAATPSAAEQISRDAGGTIHLLLTDVVMPEMSGFELSARLQADRPDLRVVYMSGYPKPMFAEGGGEMPGARFIAKPFDRQALLRSIRQALDVTDAG